LKRDTGRKVIYLIFHTLDARDAKRFGLTELQDAGLRVEVWDLSHFLHPKVSELGIESPSWLNLTVISSVGDFSDLCSTLTTEDVVILIGGLQQYQLWRARKLLRLISSTPARLGSISSGNTPPLIRAGGRAPLVGGRIGRTFGLFTQPRKWTNIPSYLMSLIIFKLISVQRRMHLHSSIRPLDHIWAGTMVAKTGIASIFITESTKVTYIHTLDYDLVLSVRDSGVPLTSRVVFIDSMGPFHPDYFLNYGNSDVSAETYSAIICRGLDKIEKRLEAEVVVAANPRAAHGMMEPWYGGRVVEYGKTAELIASATAVIVSSGSTAIGMAVVFRRPLLLLNSNMFDSFVQVRSRAAAQALDTQLIDLDALELPPFTLDVNAEAYAQYVQKYVKRQGTPEAPFWSVVASEIVSGAQSPGTNMVD
jgi:hypothetical protein